jgi:hypothetical protein
MTRAKSLALAFYLGAALAGAALGISVDRMLVRPPQRFDQKTARTRFFDQLHLAGATRDSAAAILDTREAKLKSLMDSNKAMLAPFQQALARNEIVAFGVDRYVAGASTAEIPFFGEPAKMAVTPMALALHLRVPVILAVGWHVGRNHYHGVIRRLDLGTLYEQAHVRTAAEANRFGASSVAELKQRAPVEGQRLFLEQFEQFILARPGQWVSALSRVWPEPWPVGATSQDKNADAANLVRQGGDRTSVSAYNGSRAAAREVSTNTGLASSPQPSSPSSS